MFCMCLLNLETPVFELLVNEGKFCSEKNRKGVILV